MQMDTITKNSLFRLPRTIPLEMSHFFPSQAKEMVLDAKNQFEQRVAQVIAKGKVDVSFFGDLRSLFDINEMFQRGTTVEELAFKNINTGWMAKYNEIHEKAGFFSHVTLRNGNPLEFRKDLVQFFEQHFYIRNNNQIVLNYDGVEIICELGENSKVRPFNKRVCQKDISQLINYMERFKKQLEANAEGYSGVMCIDGVVIAHPKIQIKVNSFYDSQISMGFISNVDIVDLIIMEKFKKLLNLANS